MNKFRIFAALCCAAAVFAACDKSNEPKNGSNNNDSNNDDQKNDTEEAVDLGLPSGLKWATYNVGATKPEEYGNYYAWGETDTKETYSWDTYKYGSDYSKLTKYNATDGLTTLEAADDAVANWGGSWRMPTKAEAQELIDSCAWNLVRKNGVMGYLVVGKNSNSIFLPAAGYRSNDGYGSVGVYGYYWTSDLFESNPSVAYELIFNTYAVRTLGDYRFDGRTIRPVCD